MCPLAGIKPTAIIALLRPLQRVADKAINYVLRDIGKATVKE